MTGASSRSALQESVSCTSFTIEGLFQLEGLAQYLDSKAQLHPRDTEYQAVISGFTEKLQQVKAKAKRRTTVIGVLGTTGSGKSSLINALLDEGALLPTSCKEACTAAPTEVSYTYDPEFAYRAEVEFVSVEEWEQELSLLSKEFDALKDYDPSNRSEVMNELQGTLAKLKAVCPRYRFKLSLKVVLQWGI